MRMKIRMNWTTKRAGAAAGLIAALAIAAPVSAANAQTPAVLAPAALPATPALPPVAAAAAAAALAGGLPPLPALPQPLVGQIVIGPTTIGDVLNGGTAVVVSNSVPVNSGNVIAAP